MNTKRIYREFDRETDCQVSRYGVMQQYIGNVQWKLNIFTIKDIIKIVRFIANVINPK